MVNLCQSARLLLLLVFVTGWCFHGMAEPLSTSPDQTWTVDGAPIHSLAQTKDGYLWVGTEDGLYRFDGYSFHQVQPNPSMGPLKRVLSLAAGGDGSLWVRSEGVRLFRFKQGAFTEPYGDEDDSNKLYALGPSAEKVVASTYGPAAVEIQPDGTMLPLTNHLRTLVLSVTRDVKGSVWLGSREIGVLQVLADGTVRPLPGKTPKKINCLLSDRGGGLWFGTDQGLFRFRDGVVIRQSLPRRFAQDEVISLMEDSLHRIWVGTAGGLLRVDATDDDHVETIKSVPSGISVQALIEDREGNVWIAQGSSLTRLRESSASHFNPCGEHDLEDYGAFRVDPSGVWFAPRSGGLMRIASGGCRRISLPRGGDVLYTIDFDRDRLSVAGRSGFVWTSDGVLHFKGGKPLGDADSSPIFCQRRVTDGSVWFGTLGSGAVRWDGLHAAVINEKSGLQSSTVYAIEQNSDRSLWFGGPMGISVWSDGVMKPLALNGQLPSSEILSLRSSRLDVMWVGTRKGLGFYRNGAFHSVPISSNPQGVAVYGMSEDESGHLWLSTSGAMMSVPEAAAIDGNLRLDKIVRVLAEGSKSGGSEGIQRDDTVQSGRNGEIWMARSQGLVKVNSRLFRQSAQTPIPQIEGVEVDGIPTNLMPILKVEAGARRLSFDIVGLRLSAPDSVLLRYRLQNFEADWSPPTTLREASYTNLSPGRYQFQVEATDTPGEWTRPAELQVDVLPYIWETNRFRIIVAASALVLAFLAIRLRIRYVVRETAARIHERVDERAKIARDLHDTFLQGLQGLMLKFRTIAGQMDEGTAKNILDDTLAQSVAVMDEGRDLLVSLRVSDGSRVSDTVADLTRLTAQLRGEDVSKIVLEALSPSHAIRDVVWRETLLICREAISNAIVHATANTITVRFKANEQGIELTVEDDGIGLPREILEGNKPEGRWGILGMRERSDSIGGRLTFEPARPNGTVVRLQVPRRAAYPRRWPRLLSWINGEP